MGIATLTIDLIAKLGNIERDLGRVAHIAEQNSKRMSAAFGSVKTALAGIGVGISIAGFTSSIRGIIDGADQLQKASQKYGIAVEQLSALQYAGSLADVSLEAIGTGLKKLSVNMLDTAAGTGDAKEAFKALGISVNDVGGHLKSSDAVLAEIADRFAGMEDGAGKTALAVKLFGKAGADLIPLLNGGSRGLREMKEEAEQLGVIVGGDLARASEQFNDNLERLRAASTAAGIALANDVLPSLNKITEAMVASYKATGNLLSAFRLLDGLDADNPVAALEAVETRLSKLQKLRAEIQNSSANKSAFRDLPFIGTAGDLANLEKQIKFAEQQRAALSDLSKRRGAFDFGPPVWESKWKAPVSSGSGEEAAKKEQSAYESLNKSLTEKIAAQELDLATTGKLSAAEREYAGFLAATGAGMSRLNASHQAEIKAKYEKYVANERLLKVEEESAKRNEESLGQAIRNVEALEKEVAQLRARGEEIGLTAEKMGELEQRRIDAAIAIREEEIASRMLTDADEGRLAIVRAEIELLKEKRTVLAGNRIAQAAADSAKKAEDEWKRSSENIEMEWRRSADNIERSLTDALLRGFEGGKDVAKNFRDVLFNMFRTLVLQPMIKPIVEPIAQATNLFGKMIADLILGGFGGGSWMPTTGLDFFVPSARGNVFAATGLSALSGKILDRPTIIPFALGGALAGEAGPEAIMPLRRGRDGRLGIEAAGGVGVIVNVIEAPGTKARVQQREDPGGRSIIDIVMENTADFVAQNIVKGGVVADALQGTYALNRAAGAWR